MQRSLIREFFEEAGLGPNGTPTLLASDNKDDGAPQPAAGPAAGAAPEWAENTAEGGAPGAKDGAPGAKDTAAGSHAAERTKSGWRAAVSLRRPRAPATPRPTAPPPPR
jgi:hypothetical protein